MNIIPLNIHRIFFAQSRKIKEFSENCDIVNRDTWVESFTSISNLILFPAIFMGTILRIQNILKLFPLGLTLFYKNNFRFKIGVGIIFSFF